ncbi:MAG: DUF222 domain-containing protein, partial [Actinomycetota bacterium]
QRLLETEAQFVTLAEQWEPGQLHRYAQTVRHAYDPEATVAEEARKHDLRHLGLASTLDGVVYLRGNGPAEAGAVIDTALTALAAKTAGDLRSRGQRYFDALETLCRAYLDAGQLPTSGGARPHITVLVDLTTLQGHPGSKMADLGYAGQISGEAARRLCCDADITRILTDGPSVLLDVGREQRTVTPTMRRALAARDKGCVFPRCGAAPGQCQAHHLIHWARGGTTSLDTMGLICPYHHRAVHEGRWTLHHNPDGSWTANPP